MENININVKVVEDNRPSVVEFGKLYGKRIFKATKQPCNPAFNEQLRDAEHSNGLTTNRSPFRYKVQAIDIVALELDKSIDGSDIVIINRGRVDAAGNSVEVQCPIGNHKFTKDVTTDTITEALNKGDNNTMFFASGKQLATTLNTANQTEIARIDSLIEALKSQRNMIEMTANNNNDSVESYYHQLDGKKTVVSATVVVD